MKTIRDPFLSLIPFPQQLLRLVLLFGILSVGNSPAQAQDLTLGDAIGRALEKNHGIKVARLQAEAGHLNAHPGNAGLLPKLDLNGSAAYSLNNTNLEFAGGIPPAEIKGAASSTLNTNLALSYTLFDGLGTFRNYDKLKMNAALGDVSSRLSIEGTLMQVINAYYNYAMAEDQLEIAREALQISRERVQREQLKNEFGGGIRVALLSAEVDLNTDSISLANAQLSAENARRTLGQLIGIEGEVPFTVDRQVEYQVEWDLSELKNELAGQNAAVALAAYNKNLAELDYRITRATQMPRLSLNASYAINSNTSEAGIVLLNQSNGLNGNLALNFNLFDGFRKSKALQIAEVSIASNDEAYEDALSQARTQLENAWATYQNSLNILDLQQNNLQKADLNFERTREALAIGQVTTTQFREAQLNLVRSRMGLAASRYNAKLAEMEVTRLAGKLLQEN